MKDSQFPDTEFGNALKGMVNRSESVCREYITQDYEGYEQVCEIPKEVAHFWLRSSPVFQMRLLNWYMIGPAAEDPEKPIRWMNKGAIRVDDGSDSYREVWLYLHDFTYYVVRPRRK